MSDSPPQLSVVVPAHDGAVTLGAQLLALTAQVAAEPFEIVVVDNCSTDATAQIVQQWAERDARVRLVEAHAGAGPSYARNVGMRACRAERVACCDADDVVAPGWVAAMVAALRDHPFVGGQLEVERLNAPWVVDGRGRAVGGGLGRYGDIEFAHGCNLGIRRTLALEYPFDETLRAGEEIDLAVRLRDAGVRCAFVAGAVVHYRYRSSTFATMRQAFAYGRVQRVLAVRAGRAAPRHRGWRRAVWLVARVPLLARRSGRIRWVWIAGVECGRLANAPRRRSH